MLTRYAGQQYREICAHRRTRDRETLEDNPPCDGGDRGWWHIAITKPTMVVPNHCCAAFSRAGRRPLITRDEREFEARGVKREDVPMDEEGISLTGEMMRVFREGSAFEEEGKGRGSE
ncbi:MAG: hypothetical protein ACLTCB_00255 [Merdibacter sp.]